MFPGQPAAGYRPDAEFRPELIDACRSEAENVRSELLGILAHLGAKAAPAVPHILPLTLEPQNASPQSQFQIADEARNTVKSITGSDQALIDYWKRAANDESLSPEQRGLAERLLSIYQERETQRRETDAKRSEKGPSGR
jgi:hypothetical protein